MNRSRRVIKNTIWEMGYYLIVILMGFLAPRFIILYYSSEVNGLSSTITQILNIILILQAGATTAAIYSLYKPISENDYSEICRQTAYAEKFFKKIALIFVGIAVVVAIVAPLLLKTELDKWHVCIAFILMGLKSFIDLYYTAKFRIVFTAYQEKFYVSIATMTEQVFYYAMVFVTIFCQWHFLLMYAWFLIGCIIKVIILDIAFWKKHPSIITKKYRNEKGSIGGRNHALANEVAHSVVNSSITIILSFMYGLNEASVYAVYALISQALSLIATSIYSSFAPSFGNLIAQDDRKNAARVFSIFQYIYIMLNTFLMMCMMFLIVPFVKVYTAGVTDINYINYSLAIILVLSGLFSAYRIPYNVVVSACGYFKETWKQPVLCAFISIFLSIGLGFLNYSFIVFGPACFYFMNFVYQHFKLKKLIPWLINKNVFILLAISLFGIGIAIGAVFFISVPPGIVWWIIYAIVFSIITLVFLFFTSTFFLKDDFTNSLQYIKKLLWKK